MQRSTALLFVLLSPALYGATLAPLDVLRHWRTAVHAAGGGVARTTIVASTTDEDAVDREVTEWIASAGPYRRVTKGDFDESEIVVGGAASARRDWNGFRRALEGEELRRLRTVAFERRTLFDAPQLTADAHVTPIDDHTIALRETPDGATTITWFIDLATWLPLRSARPGVDTTITTSFADWSDESGVRVPRHLIVAETDKPEYHENVTSVRREHKLERFELPKPGPSDVHADANIPPIPFNFENSHIMFKASVNGRPPLWFLFDTGADQEVINSTRAKEFGIKPYGKSSTTGGGNTAAYDYARDVTIALPGVELRNQHVATIDETGLERALGMPIAGLLGYDFISRFVVEIDYEKQLMTLHDPKGWHYAGAGFIIPITFDEGIPFMHGTISVPTKPAIPAFFVLDFGAQETMTLTSPFVKQHDLARLAQTGTTVNRPAGLEKEFFAQNNVRGRIDLLTLGRLHARSIPVNMSVNTHGAYASTSFSGTIGQGIYRRYHVVIDYPRQRVILEPTAEASKPFPERQTYGLSILASGVDLHTYTVAAVRPGSPAEADGFRKGDIISGFDGSPALAFTLGELRDKLSRTGERHEIRVTRANDTVILPVAIRLISIDRS